MSTQLSRLHCSHCTVLTALFSLHCTHSFGLQLDYQRRRNEPAVARTSIADRTDRTLRHTGPPDHRSKGSTGSKGSKAPADISREEPDTSKPLGSGRTLTSALGLEAVPKIRGMIRVVTPKVEDTMKGLDMGDMGDMGDTGDSDRMMDTEDGGSSRGSDNAPLGGWESPPDDELA